MHESQAVTILVRRFLAKRAFATDLAAIGWQLGLLGVSAGRLAAAADRGLHVVGRLEYRWAWHLQRFFPPWFLRCLETLRDAQLARSGPQPR